MPYYVVLEIADFNPRSREGSDYAGEGIGIL